MKSKNRSSLRFPATAAVALAALVAFAPAAARAGGRSATLHGARGGVYHREIARSPGVFSAAGSATLPGGQTASRSVLSQRTETGRTTTAQATGFNGKTATYNSTTIKTDTGYVRQAGATGPAGTTAAKQVTVTNQDGVVTRTVTTTTTPPQS